MTHFDFVSLANARCLVTVDAQTLLNFMLKAKDIATKSLNEYSIEVHDCHEIDGLINKVVTSCKGA